MKARQSGNAHLAAAVLFLPLLVACGSDDSVTAPSTGSISVLTSTSGLVTGSYAVRVDEDVERSVEPNGSVIYSDVEPGEYSVLLLSVPSNCSVDGPNPRSLSVAADAVARTTFFVTCINEPPEKPGDPGDPGPQPL